MKPSIQERAFSATGEQPDHGFVAEIRVAIQRLNGQRFRGFLIFLLVLSMIFSRALSDLSQLAIGSGLYSHIFLIPVVSLYLIGLRARVLPTTLRTSVAPGLCFLALGVLILLLYQWAYARGWSLERVDYLARSSASFLAFATAGAFLFLGTPFMRVIAFPWAFLVFIVPFPVAVENAIEVFFQHTSAEAANVLLNLANVPNFRDGLSFKLPGITIRVAQECSGIRSSFVLFITSLIAGQMFLRSPWNRAMFSLAVIPLGILRNGLRILTISWLCVHVGPEMIDSPIHHRGGPVFFALSLIPFFLLLFLLRRFDRKSRQSGRGGGKTFG